MVIGYINRLSRDLQLSKLLETTNVKIEWAFIKRNNSGHGSGLVGTEMSIADPYHYLKPTQKHRWYIDESSLEPYYTHTMTKDGSDRTEKVTWPLRLKIKQLGHGQWMLHYFYEAFKEDKIKWSENLNVLFALQFNGKNDTVAYSMNFMYDFPTSDRFGTQYTFIDGKQTHMSNFQRKKIYNLLSEQYVMYKLSKGLT